MFYFALCVPFFFPCSDDSQTRCKEHFYLGCAAIISANCLCFQSPYYIISGQGLQTGSQAVGRGRAVSRGAHTVSQAVGGEYIGSQAVGRGRVLGDGRAQRHSATVEELPNEREGNIDEDESDIEIEENPLPPHREDVTHMCLFMMWDGKRM